MKKVIPVLMFMMCIMTTNAKTQLKENTRIMVISDPHILTDANAASLSFNKGGKLDKMSPTIFAKAVETIVQAKPEALLVCGDMTFNGEASGHKLMVSALKTIEEKGIPVLVIPGNHDVMNPFSEDDEHANIHPKQFKELYGDFGFGEDHDLENIGRDEKSLSWSGSLKGTNLGIIGLDANIYDSGSEFYSDGCLRKSTIEWMADQATALRAKGKMVICMVHQQLVEHLPGQSLLAQSTLLNRKHTKNPTDKEEEDAVTLSDLQKAFADAQIKYVLTGHFHIHHTQNKTVKNSKEEDFTLTELTTGGLSTYPNWMRTLVFDTKEGKLASSTSTMIQAKVGEQALQTVAKEELSTWANENYGASISAGIVKMNIDVDNYEIYDGTTLFQQEESAYKEVRYTRNFDDNNWQPLYVPFDMQYSDWSEKFELAKLHSVNGDSLDFTQLKEGDMLEKNTPALIRLKATLPQGQYTITSSVKTSDLSSIMPIESDMQLSDIELHGTYEGETGDYLYQNNCYIVSAGKLITADNSANGNEGILLQPQRWFLTENSGSTSRDFTLNTGIPIIRSDREKAGFRQCKFFIDGQLVIFSDNKLFNVKGQELKRLPNGEN